MFHEALEGTAKIKNAILKKDPNGDYEFKLKTININGVKRGCSGFIKKGNNVVYISTEYSDSYLNYLYRYAKDFKDYTGHNNQYAKTFDGLIDAIIKCLNGKSPFTESVKRINEEDKFRYEGKTKIKQITKDEWNRTPNDYKFTKNGKKYLVYLDKDTQATVLGRCEIIDEDLNISEGDVVSLLDDKDKKNDNFVKRNVQPEDIFSDDELKDIENTINDNTLHIKIEGVKVTSCDKLYGVTLFSNGDTNYYEGFQDKVYSVDYTLEKLNETVRLGVIAYLTIDEMPEQKEFHASIILGSGRYDVNLMDIIEERSERELDKRVEFSNKVVQYYDNRYEKEFNIFKQRIENGKKKLNKEIEKVPDNQNFVRDYRKDPMDVQVGDVLVCIWGYSMTLVDYYRVTERKAKSIRLEKLQTKILTGGGYQGTCMPTSEVASERQQEDVKNKLFRIGASWSKDVVCRVKDHGCYFWDGKPDSYDHMD